MNTEPEVETLSDETESLWRNVNPGFVIEGQVTSQAFRPTSKDKGRLSTSRERVVDAEGSYKSFTEDLGYESSGILAVTVGEANAEGFDAEYDEKVTPTPCLKGHTSIDMSALGSNAQKSAAGRLKQVAVRRGWHFRP